MNYYRGNHPHSLLYKIDCGIIWMYAVNIGWIRSNLQGEDRVRRLIAKFREIPEGDVMLEMI
jgi:hypothetical protein